ncbi:MAG: hypothetical protein QXV39_08885, partial [Candidatus Caldarchaeum sp.]
MKVKNLVKKPDNKALSGPILALILLVVGVALALVAASIAGGFLFGWGAAPKVSIEKVDILVDTNGNGFITVDVRNAGGSVLTGCQVTAINLDATFVPDSQDIAAGRSQTFTADHVAGPALGDVYTFRAQCTAPTGQTVSDTKT